MKNKVNVFLLIVILVLVITGCSGGKQSEVERVQEKIDSGDIILDAKGNPISVMIISHGDDLEASKTQALKDAKVITSKHVGNLSITLVDENSNVLAHGNMIQGGSEIEWN